MPWGDQRGPAGSGPMTGRGMGFCAGYNAPGYAAPGFGFGRGRGFGRGMGRGFGRGFGFRARTFWGAQPAAPTAPYAAPYSQPVELSKDEKLKILKAEKEDIARELKEIERELKELEKK